MVTLEQVEKLRDRTGISYEEAKRVLEETKGDLLDAVIRLEQQNRIQAPVVGGHYQSKGEDAGSQEASQKRNDEDKEESFGELPGSFFRWLGVVLHKGSVNSFNVVKGSSTIVVVPLAVFALLLLFTFWVTLPLMIIGLVFGYRYHVSGPDVENTQVNSTMDTVSDATLRAVDTVTAAAANLVKENKQNKGEKQSGENSDR